MEQGDKFFITMGIFIASIMVALGVSALCSLMESVLLSLSTSDIAALSTKNPRLGEIWTGLKRNIERPIAVILLLNTTAHTIGASVAGASFSGLFGNAWIGLFSVIFTFLMLQYTEILPKTLGVRFNRRLARLFGRPLMMSVKILSPIIDLIHLINRPFEPAKQPSEKTSTLDEIMLMTALARQRDLIGRQQERIIIGAAKLSQKYIKDIMIPIEDVVTLSDKMEMIDALELAHNDAHTRFPVCHEENKNDIRGYVNFKELVSRMNFNDSATMFRELVRPIIQVEGNTLASDLLKKFVEQHQHIAIVRDEQHHSIGMVSLEDIIEELVGEIEDEFDRLPRTCNVLPTNSLVIGGGLHIREVHRQIKEVLGIDLLDAKDLIEFDPKEIVRNQTGTFFRPGGELPVQYQTLAHCLQERLPQPPQRGDQLVYRNILFKIRRVRRKHIFDVSIRRAREGEQTATGGTQTRLR